MLSTEAAEISFKIYSLCQENYMLDFLFTLKITLIPELLTAKQLIYNEKAKNNNTLSSSSRVILQLCKDLFKGNHYRDIILHC